MADSLTPSVSEDIMEGLAEHEILAGTYEAYLLAYRIGEYLLNSYTPQFWLSFGEWIFFIPKEVHFLDS